MTQISPPWLHQPHITKLCHLIESAGHHLWFVGGAVRNTLQNKPITDIDAATTAHPQQLLDLAHKADIKAIPTGVEHGTVTFVIDRTPIEITTLRTESNTDGRHADVHFTTCVHDDAKRRDFTMNALYLTPLGQLIDPLCGADDARKHRIRFIGNPHDRIVEDYLRILRFFRFNAFAPLPSDPHSSGIDPEGLAACAAHLDGLDTLSQERVTSEFTKTLSAPDPSYALASFASCGALLRILGQASTTALAPLVHLEQTFSIAPDWRRRLSVLCGDLSHSRLRLSKADQAYLKGLASDLPDLEHAYRFGAQNAIDRSLRLHASLGTAPTQAELQALTKASQATCPISAKDLMPRYQGPALGQALSTLEQAWISSQFTLTKQELILMLK